MFDVRWGSKNTRTTTESIYCDLFSIAINSYANSFLALVLTLLALKRHALAKKASEKDLHLNCLRMQRKLTEDLLALLN